MYEKRSVAFTGGGTGGHVFPGLSIIEELDSSTDIFWIGSSNGPEKTYVAQARIPFFGVPAGKLRRYFSFKNFSDVVKILIGIQSAKKLLKGLQPSVLVSLGGYVSVPVVIAAHSLRIPVISLVCDLSMGLATKINMRFSSSMVFIYKDSYEYFVKTQSEKKKKHSPKPYFLGMPMRKSCSKKSAEEINKTYNINPNQKVLLVLGGSSGSKEINSLVLKILPTLKKNISVLHQTGENNTYKDLVKNMPACEAQYICVPFFAHNYGSVLQRATCALTRAGTNTLWEISHTHIPSVVIPLSKKLSRGDQIENAEYFAKYGVIDNLGPEPSENTVQKALESLLYNKKHYLKLKVACKNFSSPHTSKEYVNIIHSYLS